MAKKIYYKVVSPDRGSIGLWPDDSPYYRVYNTGQIIKAEESTLGIFVFNTLQNAVGFIKSHTLSERVLILKVFGFGKEIRPGDIIASSNKYDIENFYSGIGDFCSVAVPSGTICFPAVKVLD